MKLFQHPYDKCLSILIMTKDRIMYSKQNLNTLYVCRLHTMNTFQTAYSTFLNGL